MELPLNSPLREPLASLLTSAQASVGPFGRHVLVHYIMCLCAAALRGQGDVRIAVNCEVSRRLTLVEL